MTVNPKQYKNKRNFHKIMNNTVSGSYVTLATQTGSCLAFTSLQLYTGCPNTHITKCRVSPYTFNLIT